MITQEFKQQVREALILNKEKYPDTSEKQYAKSFGLSASVYSRIKQGEVERLASDNFWIEAAMKLGVGKQRKQLKLARTEIYNHLEDAILFCKKFSKSTIIIDECGIGKTRCSKHVVSQLDNGYFVDCSQGTYKTEFIRLLARTLGLDDTGRIVDIKTKIKYYLNLIENPVIVLDDAGYLQLNVFIEIIELWNATDKQCAWVMLGDDSFQNTLERGLNSKKKGFRALYSRFSDECVHLVPRGEDRKQFLLKLISDVASVNVNNQAKVKELALKCIGKGKTLRHLETLIDLKATENE